MTSMRLNRDVFNQDTLDVARQLLGTRLVRIHEGRRIAGIIIETEAYRGQQDLGCHARSGLTERTSVMFGKPGHAYVYFTYGLHWMLNCVTEGQGFPAAVLIRAILPTEGLEIIASRRNPQPRQHWTDGPAKICQALGIGAQHNGLDLCHPGAELFVEWAETISPESVTTSPRVGLYTVPEPWKSIPWRFTISANSIEDHG